MRRNLTSWTILVLAVMWLIATSTLPALAVDDSRPQPKDPPPSPTGGGCTQAYMNWCKNNLKNDEGKACRDIKYIPNYDGAGHCECDCMDKFGGRTPSGGGLPK